MDDAFKFVESNGIALESDYSYTGSDGTCNSSSEKKSAFKITGYTDVP